MMKNTKLIKIGTAALILAGGVQMSEAADTKAPAANKPDPAAHFNKRIAEIEKAIGTLPSVTSGVVVLLGDSITEGNKVTTLGGFPVVNQGISGDQVDKPEHKTGVRNRLAQVTEAKPTHVFLLIGINDLWGGQETAQQVTAQFDKLLPELRQAVPKAKIYVQSIMPAGGDHAHLQQKVDAINTLLPKMAAQIKATFLNLDPLLKGENGKIKPEFTTDGIHLSKAGYDAWIAKLEETLAAE